MKEPFILLRLGVLVVLLLFLNACKAVTAIHRSVRFWLKGNSCFSTTGSTYSCEHFSGCFRSIFAGIPARLAALRLILEASLCIKFLLAGGEYKFLAAFFTDKCLVLVHFLTLSLTKSSPSYGIAPTDLTHACVRWAYMRVQLLLNSLGIIGALACAGYAALHCPQI